MKKKVLLLFLASLIANAKTQGLLTNETSLEIPKGEKLKYLQENRLEVFSFNKDLYIFSEFNKGEIKQDENVFKLGLSYDKNISSKFSTGVFLGYKGLNQVKNKELEKELLNHLTLKNKYSNTMNFFQKKIILSRKGYIDDKDLALLLSFNLKSSVKNTDIYLASSYSDRLNKKSEYILKNYFETDSRLNLGFLNFKLEHEYSKIEKDAKDIFGKYTKKDKVKNSDNAGSLYSEIKFSSSRLIPKSFFYNQLKVDLKSGILAKDQDRFFEVESKNYIKTNINKNLDLIGKAEIETKYTKDKTNSKYENIKNTVRLTIEPVYEKDNIKNTLSTKVDISITDSKSKNKQEEITRSVNSTVSFDIKDNLEVKIKDNLKLIANLNYRNYFAREDFHDALIDLGIDYNLRKDKVLFNTRTHAKYRMFGLSPSVNYKKYTKENKDKDAMDIMTNSLFIFNESSLSYLTENTNLTFGLNVYSELELKKLRTHILEEVKEEKKDKKKKTNMKKKKEKEEEEENIDLIEDTVEVNAAKPRTSKKPKMQEVMINKDFFNHLTYINPNLKFTYTNKKVKMTYDLDGYFAIDSFYKDKYSYAIINKNELKYYATDKLDLISNFDIDYRNNKLSVDEMNNFKQYVDDAGYVLFKYEKYRDYRVNLNKDNSHVITKKGKNEYIEAKKKYGNDKEETFEVKDVPKEVNTLSLKPMIGSDIRLVNSKLVISPKVGVNVIFTSSDKQKIPKYSKVNTLLDLNIKYVW